MCRYGCVYVWLCVVIFKQKAQMNLSPQYNFAITAIWEWKKIEKINAEEGGQFLFKCE